MLAQCKTKALAGGRSEMLGLRLAVVLKNGRVIKWRRSATTSDRVLMKDVVLCPARQISEGRRRETSNRWPAGGFKTRDLGVAASGGKFKSAAMSSSEVDYKERKRACGSRRQPCRNGRHARLRLSISVLKTKDWS